MAEQTTYLISETGAAATTDPDLARALHNVVGYAVATADDYQAKLQQLAQSQHLVYLAKSERYTHAILRPPKDATKEPV
jgi:hypothetical protein